MKWWMPVVAAVLIFAGGFVLGRRSVPSGGGGVGVAVQAPDAGTMPASVASATTGTSTATSGSTITITPPARKPRRKPIRVVADDGHVDAVCPDCPELPTVTVTDRCTANTTPGEAHAEAPVVVVPVKGADVPRAPPKFGLGPAALLTYNGDFGIGAAVSWQPARWVEFHATATTKAAGLDALLRFDL